MFIFNCQILLLVIFRFTHFLNQLSLCDYHVPGPWLIPRAIKQRLIYLLSVCCRLVWSQWQQERVGLDTKKNLLVCKVSRFQSKGRKTEGLTLLTGAEFRSENTWTTETFITFWTKLVGCWAREEEKRSIFPDNIWHVSVEPHEIYNIFLKR